MHWLLHTTPPCHRAQTRVQNTVWYCSDIDMCSARCARILNKPDALIPVAAIGIEIFLLFLSFFFLCWKFWYPSHSHSLHNARAFYLSSSRHRRSVQIENVKEHKKKTISNSVHGWPFAIRILSRFVMGFFAIIHLSCASHKRHKPRPISRRQ